MIQNKKLWLHRLLRLILPLVLLFAMIWGSTLVKRQQIGADTDSVYVKATVTHVLEDYSGGEAFRGIQKVQATVTGGQYKGQSCILNNANSYQGGAFCAPGTKIIAMVRPAEDGTLSGAVYNYDRTPVIILLVALFALILIFVGGKKGAAALYALILTFVCVLCMYIPLLYLGINGILAAIATAIVILVASLYILNGWSGKTLCAILGTTTGVAISGLLAMLAGKGASLSGYNMEEVESMLFISDKIGLDLKNILYAGVLISSLGAVMDVSVSVVAAMQEVHQQAPKLKAGELFESGMRVGRDMMGTMSNTLILAYTGSATGILLGAYSYQWSYPQMMGNNPIVIEILCGLCGTIGVVLTVPIQAGITALYLKRKKK